MCLIFLVPFFHSSQSLALLSFHSLKVCSSDSEGVLPSFRNPKADGVGYSHI